MRVQWVGKEDYSARYMLSAEGMLLAKVGLLWCPMSLVSSAIWNTSCQYVWSSMCGHDWLNSRFSDWQKTASREIEPNEAKEEWYRKAKNLLKNQSDSDEPQESTCIWRCLEK